MIVLRGDHRAWDPPAAGAAVAVGVFDGVHRGHRAVLDRTRAAGADVGDLPLSVLTFDPHPMSVIQPERAPQLLCDVGHRLELLEGAGVATCGVLTFDEAARSLPPEDFAGEVLVGAMGATVVAVGAGFRFGWDRSGDVESLRTFGLGLGYYVEEVELFGDEGPVSSTTIRSAVARGDMMEAAAGLGRWFELRGRVMSGEGRGTAHGFPTANIDPAPNVAVPARGVYAVLAGTSEELMPAVANIGVRPTFGEEKEVVEVHLLDFTGDLYGAQLRVQFVARLRDEQRFDGVDGLVAQIAADIRKGRELLAEASLPN